MDGKQTDMTLEPRLRYPDCPECQLLDKIAVDRKLINAYHKDEIDITRLPKVAQRVLKEYRRRKGYGRSTEAPDEPQ